VWESAQHFAPDIRFSNSTEVLMPSPEIALLLRLIAQAYDRPAWHGPNLKGSIRRIKAREAIWRPGVDRKSIAEHVVHSAYWKYAVRRQLRGDRRGTFPLKGSNWFVLGETLSDSEWKSYVALLEAEHRQLCDAVSEFPATRLQDLSAKKKYRCVDLIMGVASHDIYHAGQIQLLKRLLPDGESN
jgi:uncharacterized damage-inducible protein DinB